MFIGSSDLYRKCAGRNIPSWNYGDHGSDKIAAVCRCIYRHSVFNILNEPFRYFDHNINDVIFTDYRDGLALRNPLSAINIPFDNDAVKGGLNDLFLKFNFEALDLGFQSGRSFLVSDDPKPVFIK